VFHFFQMALQAPYVLEYTYRRSVGSVVGQFLAGLRDQRVLGIKTSSGRVLVPPPESDPETGEALSELVEVGQAGVVTTWSWVVTPRKNHPLQKPFAWALVKLDGADSAMLHAVDAGSIEKMSTGMRVRVRWKTERVGHVSDIACFERFEPSVSP
jgi:uncharacterized OB-fold protein